nr:MAG TPA: hypothetical protein [Caudoviricetes sp.]
MFVISTLCYFVNYMSLKTVDTECFPVRYM